MTTSKQKKSIVVPNKEGALFAPIDNVGPKPNFNLRKNPSPTAELLGSVKVHGVRRPIDVQWKDSKHDFLYILDGECRYRAAKELGLGSIPVTVRSFDSEREALLHSMVANDNHKRLSKAELRLGFKKLHHFGYKPEDIAKALGVELRLVTDALKIEANAIPEVKKKANKSVREGGIDSRVAGRVAVMDKDTQKKLAPKLAGVPREKGLAIVRKIEAKSGIERPGPKAENDPVPTNYFAPDAEMRCRGFERLLESMLAPKFSADRKIYIREARMMLQCLRGKISVDDVVQCIDPKGQYHG